MESVEVPEVQAIEVPAIQTPLNEKDPITKYRDIINRAKNSLVCYLIADHEEIFMTTTKILNEVN